MSSVILHLWQYLRNLLEDTKSFIRRIGLTNFLKIYTKFSKNSTKLRTFGHLRSL